MHNAHVFFQVADPDGDAPGVPLVETDILQDLSTMIVPGTYTGLITVSFDNGPVLDFPVVYTVDADGSVFAKEGER